MSASSGPIRATVDTNLFVSGLLWANTLPAQLIEAVRDRRFRLVTAAALRVEVAEVLARPKFAPYHPNAAQVAAILDVLAVAEQVVPLATLPVAVRDPKDEKLLACALGGQVDYLVSGDRDLLDLDGQPALGALRVVTVREFLDRIGVSPSIPPPEPGDAG